MWCGKSGELSHDYEIRQTMDNVNNKKGLGTFALRSFKPNEKIMVERAIVESSNILDKSCHSIETINAINKLMPNDETSTMLDKYKMNAIGCGDNEPSGLFITMSRVNHDCIGNSEHYYSNHVGVKILVATCEIKAGDEITFSYRNQETSQMRAKMLKSFYNFVCQCEGCCGPKSQLISSDLDQIYELDDRLLSFGQQGQITQAIRCGKQLIELYKKYYPTSNVYSRTYYDLFQMAITKRALQKEAIYYIKMAYENMLNYTEDAQDDRVILYKSYLNNPQSHRNHLIL
jgi:hypothetical protein